MSGETQSIVERVQDLSDVELAMLLSLTANEHCMIHTEEENLTALDDEIRLIAASVFGLSCASVQCTEGTNLETFTHGILIDKPRKQSSTASSTPNANYRASAFNFERSYSGDLYQIANILVVKCINRSDHQIQMQALELLRTRRIFTHTGVYTVPKPFLMVVVTTISSPPLAKHFNDFLFLSHLHTSEEGFPNTEECSDWVDDFKAATSAVPSKPFAKLSTLAPLFSGQDITELSKLQEKAVISTEVKRYLHDVLTFLRFHRAVATGVSPKATRHFELLVKCLIPLHGLTFATPSLVALAARKVYRHRLVLTDAEHERSMQYGSDSKIIAEILADMNPDMVIEEVLASVDVPV